MANPFESLKRTPVTTQVKDNPFKNVKRINQDQNLINEMAGLGTSMVGKVASGDIYNDIFFRRNPLEVTGKNQAIGEGVLAAGDSALLGLPKMGLLEVAKRAKVKLPEPKNKTASTVGGAFGLLAGPGRLAAQATRRIAPLAGRGAMKAVGRGVVEGGITGAVAAPAKTEDFLNPKQRAINSGVGAATGAAGELAMSGIKNIGMVATKAGRTGLVDRTRAAFRGTKRAAGQEFESVIDGLTKNHPTQLVDLDNAADQLLADIQFNPKLASALNRSPRLKKIVDMPKGQRKVTLAEAQQIKNDLTSKMSQSKLAGRGVRSDDIDLFDTIDDIRDAQLTAFPDSSFPKYAGARQEYGEVMGDYGLVRNKIREGGTERNIYNKFGGDIDTENAVERLLPKQNQQEISAARTTKTGLKGTAIAAGLGSAGTAGTYLFNELIKKMKQG